MFEKTACLCMDHLNLYKPKGVKSYYQCSEPHLCGKTQYTEEDIAIFEKIKAKNAKQLNDLQDSIYSRFRPEETEVWADILGSIMDSKTKSDNSDS